MSCSLHLLHLQQTTRGAQATPHQRRLDWPLIGFSPLYAVDTTWDGETNGVWAIGTNWVGDTTPGSGDAAIFLDGGNGNTTIDLGGAITIDQILFQTATAAAYTIGLGSGTDTITFSHQNNTSANINVATGVTADQIIAADMVTLDSSAADIEISNNSTAANLTINGNFDTGAGGTAGPSASSW